MKAFTQHTGLVAPLDRANVDTDQIIPKQFLEVDQAHRLRPEPVRRVALPGCRPARIRTARKRPLNQDFVLNYPRYQGASVLLARENFGCGSSREHAPWALEEYGFRTMIAPSFADIFFNNSFKNGLLPIILTDERSRRAVHAVRGRPAGYQLTVDLAAQTVTPPDGKVPASRSTPFRKHCLLNGLDDIGLTLAGRGEAIKAFEAKHQQPAPGCSARSSESGGRTHSAHRIGCRTTIFWIFLRAAQHPYLTDIEAIS